MANVITDKEKINELLDRGVEKIYPSREKLEELLLSGKKIRLYGGFDPSAPSLHIGNAILINKLAQFQALGHEVVFLIGDFTGMIGDPTDKKAARKKLTREEVLENSRLYQKQASIYLDYAGDNPAQTRYNSEWSDKLTFKDLIEITSNFTVQQMITRDMFQERLKEEKPIYFHEFLYPVAQGYDSVALDVDLEVGGNDQMFNMLCGRDLLKAMNNKEKFVVTTKLLADETGKKMGKSEGNAVFLNETPENIYGVIMSWPDEVIVSGFELCTTVLMSEVREIAAALKNSATNPRDYKMRLAKEITKLVHGQEKADLAEEFFIKTVQKKEMPEEIDNFELTEAEYKIIDLLVETKLAASKGEAKRLIEQGGIRIKTGDAEFAAIQDINQSVKLTAEGMIIQRGKRQFLRVLLK